MKNTLTFGKILQQAHAKIKSTNQTKKEKLTEQLEHGKGLLTSNEQLDMYLHKYGEIHQEKLIRASSLSIFTLGFTLLEVSA